MAILVRFEASGRGLQAAYQMTFASTLKAVHRKEEWIHDIVAASLVLNLQLLEDERYTYLQLFVCSIRHAY